jgi:hypothetical protein
MTSLVHFTFPQTFFVQGFSKHFNIMNTSEPTQFYSNYKIDVNFPQGDTTTIMIEFGPIPDARTLRRLNRLKKREMNGVCEPDFGLTLAYPPGVESYSNKYIQFVTEYVSSVTTVIEEPVASVIYVNDLDENPVLVDSENKSIDSTQTNVSSLNEDEIILVKENDVPFVDLSGNNPLAVVTEVEPVNDIVTEPVSEPVPVVVKTVEPACAPCCVIS